MGQNSELVYEMEDTSITGISHEMADTSLRERVSGDEDSSDDDLYGDGKAGRAS